MIDPDTHLYLHRQRQHERDRHLSHLAAFRARRATAEVISADNPAAASPWQRLLTVGRRRRPARGPTTPAGPRDSARIPASSTVPAHGAS